MHETAGGIAGVARPASAVASAVYADILRFGPRPRTELAARLGLSGPTLTRTTRRMLDDGLLRELPPRPGIKGRPQEPLDVDEEHARFLGVKITADEVHAAITTLRGVALEDLAQRVDGRDPAAVIDAVADLARPLVRAHPRVAGVGVSLPGVVVDGRVAASSHLLGWDGPVDVGGAIAARLGLPVIVDNDFASLLEGIAWSGPGRRYESFAVITVGAGVALGAVHEGRVRRGARRLAGLTEAMPAGVDREGRPRRIGEVAATAAVLARARAAGAIGPDGTLEQLLAAAADGHGAATAVADEVASATAIAAAAVIALVDPEALLLGGESAPLLDAGTIPFAEHVRPLLPPAQADLPLRRLTGDFDEWSHGAAVSAIRDFVGAP